jgi:hypothetical protein
MSFPNFPPSSLDAACMFPVFQQLVGITGFLASTVILFAELTERTHLYGVKKLIKEIERQETNEKKEELLKPKENDYSMLTILLKKIDQTQSLEEKIKQLKGNAKKENTDSIKRNLVAILIGLIRIVPIVSTVYSYRQWRLYQADLKSRLQSNRL